MRATLTISLPPKARRAIARAAKRQGVTQSEFVRRAVQHELWAEGVGWSRRVLVPKAKAKGVYTDEDVFKIIS